MRSDDELLRDFAGRGDEAAFAELVRRHVDLVYSAALRQVGRDAHLAHDVAQLVFVSLARKAPTLVNRASLAGWLFTSTHYAAANTVRAERRRRTHEQESHMMHEARSESGVAVEWERLRPVLDAAMLELNESDREIVVQRFLGGRSFADIGTALRMTEDTARKRSARALDKLHALLARRGIRSTSGALALALSSHAVSAAPSGLAATLSASALSSAALPAAAVAVAPFLTMSKLSFALAGVAVAFLGVMLVHQQRQATVARAEIAALRAEHARLTAESRDLKTRKSQHVAQAAARPANPPRGSGANSSVADIITRMSAPEQIRVALDSLYAPLFRQLKLPPAQLEALKELLLQKRRAAMSVQILLAEGKIPSDDLTANDRTQLERIASREIDERIRTFLGTGDAARFDEFHRTLSLRTSFASPVALLRSTAEPLRDDQIEALIRWTEAELPSPDRFEQLGVAGVWKQIMRGAATILSPMQLEKLAVFEKAFDSHLRIIAINRAAEAQGLIKATSHSRAP